MPLPIASLILAAAVTAAPLKPVHTINLSSHGTAASDVAWLNDDEVLVALIKGGVARVSTKKSAVSKWLPQGELPGGAPLPELIATDGNLVVVMGGSRRAFAFRTTDGKPIFGYQEGSLFPRGVAVSGGKAFYLGWMTRSGTSEDQQRGALWTQAPKGALSEHPVHRVISSSDALARWRLTMFPYAGSTVALPDGSIAVMTSAEPGIFRYDRNGRLLEVLGSGIEELVFPSNRMTKGYGTQVIARYRDFLDRQPTIDDLVATPGGVSILVRTATKDQKVSWQLWKAGRTDVERIQPLGVTANGPIAHMKCDARGMRLACVTNLPTPAQAAQPGPAGSNPTLFLFQFSK